MACDRQRVTDDEKIQAMSNFCHFFSDIILTCVWAMLFIAGAVFQFYREKGRPQFPPCPRKLRQLRRLEKNGLDPHDSSLHRQTEDDNDESSPLIRPGNRHNYIQ